MRDIRQVAWGLAILLLGAGAMGCGIYGPYCEDKMACEGGNDADVESCIIDLDADEDRAALWGCEDLWDEQFTCREERAICDGHSYTTHDACRFERDRYNACMPH